MYKPIQIKDLDLSFAYKTCFDRFHCQIPYGSRIAIIGRNGSGKSTLLNMIKSLCNKDVVVGYVPQIIVDHTDLSGGQRLNKAVTDALSLDPNLLLLDEPTNHLDLRNRKSLMRMLQNYPNTLIIVSHDKELLRDCTDILWHIDCGKVQIFSGNYDDYMREMKLKRASIKGEFELLSRIKKDMHHKLMQEQQRAAKSKAKGKKSIDHCKWSPVIGNSKAMQADENSGRKKSTIYQRKADLATALSKLSLPEIIVPKFTIESSKIHDKILIQISNGSIGYGKNIPLLTRINLSIYSGQRLSITGDNGCGKSTLIKAILNDKKIHKTGDWSVLKQDDIGYLDQHYDTLNPDKTVLQTIVNLVPHWPYTEIRSYLNDFLFRKNEEVAALVSMLSGGEKARLSLAQMAVKTPELLILDEITNNLDLETKEHVAQVLKAYPGALILISHDCNFLKQIEINETINVTQFRVC